MMTIDEIELTPSIAMILAAYLRQNGDMRIPIESVQGDSHLSVYEENGEFVFTLRPVRI